MSLKRKKAYEKQIEQIDNSIARVNEQQMMLENQRTTAETVLALQQGVRANKATMQASVPTTDTMALRLSFSAFNLCMPSRYYHLEYMACCLLMPAICPCLLAVCTQNPLLLTPVDAAGNEHRGCGQDHG